MSVLTEGGATLLLPWQLTKYLNVAVNPMSGPVLMVNISKHHESSFYDLAFLQSPHPVLFQTDSFTPLNCGPQKWYDPWEPEENWACNLDLCASFR